MKLAMLKSAVFYLESRPARGAWIETGDRMANYGVRDGRAPRGARGLKHKTGTKRRPKGCRAPRGARGLKLRQEAGVPRVARRAPRGARGLKPRACPPAASSGSRAPRGARGLKHPVADRPPAGDCRAPRGARGLKPMQEAPRELPRGRAPRGARGLKHVCSPGVWTVAWSRPARGAWIETAHRCRSTALLAVAPRAGRVD